MSTPNLGADDFTFVGDRTQISYRPVGPGPVQPGRQDGRLDYQGVEGDFTFRGQEIDLQDSPLGTLVTITLRRPGDAGGVTATVLLPHVTGVTGDNPVTFETMVVKATSRGFIARPGADLTYTIVPLLATARELLMPRDHVVSATVGQP